MTYPVQVYWAPALSNTATISSLQDYAGAGNLILKPYQANSVITANGPYVYDGVVRTISFTSANNLSARSLTIRGIGSAVNAAGNPTQPLNTAITEIIVGPNANTVYSLNIFRQIDSITIDGAANGLSVGFGTTGITDFLLNDYDRTGWYASYQTALYNRATLTHTVYVSLTKPQYTVPGNQGAFVNYPEVIPAFSVGTLDSTANQLIASTNPVTICWATIKANTTANESMYFTVLQQGI